jgi:hypothetical protein
LLAKAGDRGKLWRAGRIDLGFACLLSLPARDKVRGWASMKALVRVDRLEFEGSLNRACLEL